MGSIFWDLDLDDANAKFGVRGFAAMVAKFVVIYCSGCVCRDSSCLLAAAVLFCLL